MRLLAGAVFGLVMAVMPATAAPTTELAYEILRDGKPIGTHTMRIREADGRTEVEVSTDIVFKILSLTVYTFRHQSRELWEDSRLMALESDTDDDGTPVRLRIERADGGLAIVDAKGRRPIPDLLPGSLWSAATVTVPALVDPLDGTVMKIAAEPAGDDIVDAGGAKLPAKRWRVTGDLKRELWYGEKGLLLGVRFTAKEGSEVRYRLRHAPSSSTATP